MQTSGTMGRPHESLDAAISIDDMRFSFPSVRSMPIGSWLPVKTTGLAMSPSMKLRADAEKDIVSVPCRMTKPSYLP